MVTVNNAQKYRDSITDSAESSRPAQWTALNLLFAESQSVKRTATVHSFSSKEQASFNFMVKVIIYSDLEPKKVQFVTVFIVSPSICHEVMEPDAMILDF